VKIGLSHANPPRINTYKNRACNPSRINIYRIVELKTLWNQHLQKKAGVVLARLKSQICFLSVSLARESDSPHPRLKNQPCPLALFNVQPPQRSTGRRFLLTPLERTLTDFAPVSPVDLTLTKSLDLKCPGITLLRKKAGAPLPFSAPPLLCLVALPSAFHSSTFQRFNVQTCKRSPEPSNVQHANTLPLPPFVLFSTASSARAGRRGGRTTVEDNKFLLPERDMPKSWYNVIPDLPLPLPPPLNPATGQPANPGDLEAIFPHALIEQEMSGAPTVPIPDPI